MRYGDEDRESENVEDRRSERGPMFRFPRGFPGGGAEGTRIQIPIGGGGVSLTTLIVIGVIMLVPRHQSARAVERGAVPAGSADAAADRGAEVARPAGHPRPRYSRAARRHRGAHRGRHEALRLAGSRRHRGRLDAGVHRLRPPLFRAGDGAVLRRHAHRLRHRHGADGAVLLSARPQGLHRPVVLRHD